MRKSVLLILLLAFAMQGCKKMDPMTDLDSVIVSAEEFIAEAEDFGPQTKTSLATSRKVVWSEEDQIAIFQGCSLADRFQVSDQSIGNSNGVFSFVGNPGVENGDYSAGTETTLETNVALYPYHDGIECSAITDEEDVVTSYTITGVTIPANQIYAEDSFAEESFIMAAVTEGVVDHNLKFKNVCGAIKLQLKGERTIKSISVAGKGDEVIAGEGVVTVYTDGAAPSVVMDESGEKVITLDCSEDGGVALSQEEATDFVIAVPPTPFESGFTVTITDVDDNAETFSASAGTSVERSVITLMPEIDLDEEEEITTSAYLPSGITFKSTVDAFMTGKGITEIKFITNSATTSEDALVDGSIYLVQSGQTLEIHTAADQFVANSSCSSMFYANEGWDNSTQQYIYNSFGQIQVIDFGDNFNTQNVTSMYRMFEDCSSLTSLDVSNFDTQNVTTMYMMFRNCSSLTSLDVSNFDTQNVTSMGFMFYICSSLTSLDVSNFDTQNVTSMSYMFYGCPSLTSLDVSNFDTQNVTNMSAMFFGCSSLTSLDVSNFDTQKVTDMGYMFSSCSSLTSLDVSNFDTQNATDMRLMFCVCSGLTSLDVSNFDTQNVTNMSAMFCDCSSLTSLDVSNFNTQNVTDMCGMFSWCSSLTSLDVNNFNTQNVTNMGGMFSWCSSLTSLDVSNFNTQNVTTISGMFSYCSSLTSLDLSNFDTQNVTSMVQMFYNCTSLTSLDISNFDTQNVTNMYYMFGGCSSLTSLDLSNFTFESNPEVEFMFYLTGSNATNKPIPIYVSAEGKDYIETTGGTYINSNYATLTIKASQGE